MGIPRHQPNRDRALSSADLGWAAAREPKWTLLSMPRVAPERSLSHGDHTLRVVARGETLAQVAALDLPSNYERNEVHFRGIIVDRRR